MQICLISGKYRNAWESLGLGYLAAAIRQSMPHVGLEFFHGNFDDPDEIVRCASHSHLVMFSCTSPAFSWSLRLARRIKARNKSVPIVFGGYHPSALPQETVAHDAIDQVVIGPGDGVVASIVRGRKDQIIFGQPTSGLLPWPDRKLIRNERHVAVAERETGTRITSFQSYRGCPFHCKFCADGNQAIMYGTHRWQRDASDLVAEMEWVAETYSLGLAKFCDPTWNVSRRWVRDFCDTKIKRGLALPFQTNMHAGCGDAHMYSIMANANCTGVAIGIESGSERILATIGKGPSKDQIRRAVGWAKDAGMKVRGFFIIGMPDETEDDLRQTEEFAEELQLDEYGFSFLCPYPGTWFYQQDRERYRDKDWDDVGEYRNDFWRSKHLTNAELTAWQERLAAKFSDRLGWMTTKAITADGKGTGNAIDCAVRPEEVGRN